MFNLEIVNVYISPSILSKSETNTEYIFVNIVTPAIVALKIALYLINSCII